MAMRTKTVHSEVLWALNPTNNVIDCYQSVPSRSPPRQISEALQRFGVSGTSRGLIVIRIVDRAVPVTEIEEKMKLVVDGEMVPLTDLGGLTDWQRIKTVRFCILRKRRLHTEDE
jgi:EKC/KEOPS complex subunit CGI121/TPRKB